MTTQTETAAAPPAGKHGKYVTCFWRIVNVTVILVGVFCGYSLESRHHASAAEMPAAQMSVHAAYASRGHASVCQYVATERLAQK